MDKATYNYEWTHGLNRRDMAVVGFEPDNHQISGTEQTLTPNSQQPYNYA